MWFCLLSECLLFNFGYCLSGKYFTLQQHSHQRSPITVLCLLDEQLSILQDMVDGVAPFDDAVHDIAGIVFLICTECLSIKFEWWLALFDTFSYFMDHNDFTWHDPLKLHTGLMSLLRDPKKSALVTCSFSARSMSTSTVDVAWRRTRNQRLKDEVVTIWKSWRLVKEILDFLIIYRYLNRYVANS